ncbi:MAG: hypothetical protein Q8J64_01200 [Thermodesulfovibrionales bacterium]|nr:hypothetical protein [Thermodesulfovibrionales bacterium]
MFEVMRNVRSSKTEFLLSRLPERGVLTKAIFSAGVLLFFSLTLISLEAYGRNSRASGIGHPLDSHQMVIASVDYPEEAYLLWKNTGYKGRVVVSLSSRLNFVHTENNALIPQEVSSFPVTVHNLPAEAEKGLNAKNFLFAAMKTGVAREVISILPEAVFREKQDYTGAEEGVRVLKGRIEVPFFGSPRTITAMPYFKSPGEPVLLFINASFFRGHEPEEVFRGLVNTALTADYVVLCRSFDDPEVGDADRERLRSFEMLLRGGT